MHGTAHFGNSGVTRQAPATAKVVGLRVSFGCRNCDSICSSSTPAMPDAAQLLGCFGNFELSLQSGEPQRNGHRRRLPQQSFRILTILLKRPGEVVTREELRKELWPEDTFVDFEHGVNSAVRRLREALNDAADEPKFIETLPRLGYRYLGPRKIRPEEHVASNPPDFGSPSVTPLIQSPGARSVVEDYHPLPEVNQPWFRSNRNRAIVVAVVLVVVAVGMGNI